MHDKFYGWNSELVGKLHTKYRIKSELYLEQLKGENKHDLEFF